MYNLFCSLFIVKRGDRLRWEILLRYEILRPEMSGHLLWVKEECCVVYMYSLLLMQQKKKGPSDIFVLWWYEWSLFFMV